MMIMVLPLFLDGVGECVETTVVETLAMVDGGCVALFCLAS